MTPEDKPLRIFCQSISGRDLFYIQLIYFKELNYFDFSTSLNYNLNQNHKAKALIKQIINVPISEDERLRNIDKLMLYIQTLPGIDQYYFSDDLLNSEGQYMEFYSNVICDMLIDKEFPDYTPFSINLNAFYFDYCRQILEIEINRETPIYVAKEPFEELVNLNKQLAAEYVEWLSPNSKYFIVNFTDVKNYDFYVMAINFKVVMFFVRETP